MHEIYMQNMQKYAIPTLLMASRHCQQTQSFTVAVTLGHQPRTACGHECRDLKQGRRHES